MKAKIFRAAFTGTNPKSAKNTVKPSVFFVLLESAHVIHAGKMLVKLTPGPMKAKIPRSRISVIRAMASHFALLATKRKNKWYKQSVS